MNALGLLIDAQLATLKMSNDIQMILMELANIIKRDSTILSKLEYRLRGPLLATVCETTIAKHRKENRTKNVSGYGKNWNRLVDQMELGIGEYQVQVLDL
jgi:hypothetical protein